MFRSQRSLLTILLVLTAAAATSAQAGDVSVQLDTSIAVFVNSSGKLGTA